MTIDPPGDSNGIPYQRRLLVMMQNAETRPSCLFYDCEHQFEYDGKVEYRLPTVSLVEESSVTFMPIECEPLLQMTF